MRMSCNGCRVLRKGCSENCSIRPCLEWIKNAESQANATVFLAKFYGRAALTSLISAGAEHERPAIFRSLLYEACGRMVNPVFGAVGLLWSGKWQICHAAVESILNGCPIHPISPADGITASGVEISTEQSIKRSSPSPLMQAIANELHKVKAKGRFKQSKKSSELSKDISQIILEAEASEVCNLRWGRCYSGEEDAPHCLLSSDSSSESDRHCDEPRNNEAGFEPSSCTADLKTAKAMDSSTQQQMAQTECESELELELTLCCQSPVSKQSNNPAENSLPVITYLGLGLIPPLNDNAG